MAKNDPTEIFPEEVGNYSLIYVIMDETQRREFDRLIDVEGWSFKKAYDYMIEEIL